MMHSVFRRLRGCYISVQISICLAIALGSLAGCIRPGNVQFAVDFLEYRQADGIGRNQEPQLELQVNDDADCEDTRFTTTYQAPSAVLPSSTVDEPHNFPQADCLWMGRHDEVRLSWETLVALQGFGVAPEDNRIGSCTFSHADDGRLIEYRPEESEPTGTLVAPQPGVAFLKENCEESELSVLAGIMTGGIAAFYGVRVQRLAPVVADPEGRCPMGAALFADEPTATEQPVEPNGYLCPGYDGYAPLCGLGCPVTAEQDGSYRVVAEVRDGSGGTYPEILDLGTNVMTVDGTRTIVRDLSPHGGTYAWQTPFSPALPTPDTVRWHEVFSDRIIVSEVRIERPNGQPYRRSDIVGAELCITQDNAAACLYTCTGADDPSTADDVEPARFDLTNPSVCTHTDGYPFTPTQSFAWHHIPFEARDLRPLSWAVRFAAGVSGQGSRLVFDLVHNPAGGLSARAERDYTDFGEVQVGHHAFRHLNIRNNGMVDYRVERVELTYPWTTLGQVGEFGRRLPHDPRAVPAPIDVQAADGLSYALGAPLKVRLGTEWPEETLLDIRSSGAENADLLTIAAADLDGQTLTIGGHSVYFEGSTGFRAEPNAQFAGNPMVRPLAHAVFSDRVPPFIIPAGRSFDILLAARPRFVGERKAVLEVEVVNALDATDVLVLRHTVLVESLSAPAVHLHVGAWRPVTEWVEQEDGSWIEVDEGREQIAMLLSNTGQTAAVRNSISVTGSHAAHYTVLTAHPPNQPLDPGGTELIRVEFDPACQLPYVIDPMAPNRMSAELHVETSVGQHTVPLVHYRDVVCP